MKKLKNLWQRIPRPCRVALNFLAILTLAATFYVSIGAPTVSKDHAFRRAERANLLGPSTILFSEVVEHYSYGHLILAETDDCVITWVDDLSRGFNYHEKTGDITVVTGPKYWFDWGAEWWEVNLPVFVVDDYPDAIRADLEIDIQGCYIHNLNGERYEEPQDHHFAVSSHRDDDGFFYFRLTLDAVQDYHDNLYDKSKSHGPDGYALDMLAQTFTNVWTITTPQSSADITATVRLYDDYDNLVAERELILRTAAEVPAS